MRGMLFAALLLIPGTGGATGASLVPVADAASAIAIAKSVCAKEIAGKPPVIWFAQRFDGAWIVSSSFTGSNSIITEGMQVTIPENGPMPTGCGSKHQLLIP